jgi:acyl-coenzyme A synthetase/AMP-(fatty) acid ligase
MDPTRPAEVNPARLIEAAAQWEVDQAFGSPALWNRVVRWSQANGVSEPFPTLRRVLSAGAPVPAKTLAELRKLLHPDTMIATPYGATEALPIASIESREIIAETGPAAAKGKGTCVGTRFEFVEWRVIEIDDGPIERIEDTKEVSLGKIGELMVSGPMVTKQYVVRADQNALHKVADGDRVWHRMGDVGYLDDRDRFWFCGRKAHRVTMTDRTLFTIPCEAIFNAHPAVYRSALVGRGRRPNQQPVIFIEPQPDQMPQNTAQQDELRRELLDLAARNPLTRRIQEIIIRDRPLPVDIRHNSKIFREQLAAELSSCGTGLMNGS